MHYKECQYDSHVIKQPGKKNKKFHLFPWLIHRLRFLKEYYFVNGFSFTTCTILRNVSKVRVGETGIE